MLIFVENMLQHLLGCRVVLNDRRTGRVYYFNREDITRPVLRMDEDGEIIELSKRRELRVESVPDLC